MRRPGAKSWDAVGGNVYSLYSLYRAASARAAVPNGRDGLCRLNRLYTLDRTVARFLVVGGGPLDKETASP